LNIPSKENEWGKVMNIRDFAKLLDIQLNELLENHKAELKTKQRAFIAWTLLHMSDLEMSEEDAIEAIVDGNQEKGIDAIYVPERGGKIVVLQTTCHENPSGKGVRKNELVRLFTGVDWLLDGDLTKIDKNPKFRAKAEEFREAYYNFDYSSICIVYSTTAIHGPSKEENDEIERMQEKLADRGAPFIIDIFFASQLKDFLIASIHRRFDIDIALTFVGKPLPYERSETGARAIVGVVKGSQLADLYAKHSFRIFDIDIRNFLGNVKINQGIMRASTDARDAKNFWFYNNGITFVCDELSFRSLEDTSVRLRNAQIINGCQTVTSLYRAGRSLVDDVEVLIRIIEKKGDIDFIRRVTLFANSQNAVRPSDLVGTDTIILELKRRLMPMKFYLETRRGDYRAEKDSLHIPISTVATLKQAAQALATTSRQIPGVAKKDTSKLFLTKQDGGFFEELFNPGTMPEHIVTAVSIMRAINLFRTRIENSATEAPIWLPHADFFLSALFFIVNFDQSKVNDKKYLLSFNKWISSSTNNQAYRSFIKLIEHIKSIVSENESSYGYSHPKFFKTQVEYEKWFRPLSTKKVFKSPQRFKN
jgi:hypothetical protein